MPAFPLTQKMDVNGVFTGDVWKTMKAACPAAVEDIASGYVPWSPISTRDVAWNFEAVLINKEGVPVFRYGTIVDPRFTAGDIKALLSQ